MKNLHDQVLQYLYNNDTGRYVDLYAKFVKGKVTRARVAEIANDLREYIQQDSIYEHWGVLAEGDPAEHTEGEWPELNAKINQKGREKHQATWNEIKTRNINKRIATFTLLAVMAGALPFLIPMAVGAIRARAEVIPLVRVHIDNKSPTEVKAFYLQEFYMWLPGSGRYRVGKYAVVTEDMKDEITMQPGTTVVSAKILDNKTYFPYFESKECDISLTIRDDKGALVISDDMLPFNSESIHKYYTTITIREK
jgi:hypothetical protein